MDYDSSVSNPVRQCRTRTREDVALGDGEGPTGTSSDRRRLVLEELPEAAGLVDYDPRTGRVRRRTDSLASRPESGGSGEVIRACEDCGGPREHDVVLSVEQTTRPGVRVENERFSRRPMFVYRCLYCGRSTRREG